MFYPESPSILEAIKKANKILFHLHVSPDFDSAGSALAMRRALEILGKEVVVISGDNAVPVGTNFLPGSDKIVTKNFAELDLSEFDLFIIQDSGSIDRITTKIPVVFPSHLKTIVIDHHISNNGFGEINLLDLKAPATAFMLYQLFSDWGLKIDQEIAINLFIGMYFDTGGFRFSNTTPDCFHYCSELIKIVPNYFEYLEKISNCWTLNHLAFVRLALDDLQIQAGGQVVYSIINYEEMVERGLDREDAGLFSMNATFLAVAEVKVAFTIFEKEKGITSISARSKDGEKYDVAKWLETLGGGGHKKAAGARLQMTAKEALPKVLDSLTQIWPEFK